MRLILIILTFFSFDAFNLEIKLDMTKINLFSLCLLGFLVISCVPSAEDSGNSTFSEAKKPNILFAISDDQSYPYASAYGVKMTATPNFDAIAKRGVLFTNAFCAAPQCSPSRAAILTGLNIWQLEEAGTHSSYFPKKFPVFTDNLEANGYALGYTGKPWGPGNWKDRDWSRNPVGPEFNTITYQQVPYSGVSNKNYAANFKTFLDQKPEGQPFFFWYGGHEPHRDFEDGSGIKQGKSLTDAEVPGFLPDDKIIRSDLLDYALEIEWFDQHLGKMIAELEAIGELENTIIVVTADNGMAFPYAKANLQEYGTHVPLVITGPGIVGNRKIQDLVSLIDLAPTFLSLTGTRALPKMTGKSLEPILKSEQEGLVDSTRQWVLTGRERHTHARPDNLGYPARAIRTAQYLFIQNLKPERWPAGDPEVKFPVGHQTAPGFKSMKDGYHDIDPSPSKAHIQYQKGHQFYFDLAVAKRPAEQLFDISTDPACTKDLAGMEGFSTIQSELRSKLMEILTEQEDPRVLGNGDIFESYPRFAPDARVFRF